MRIYLARHGKKGGERSSRILLAVQHMPKHKHEPRVLVIQHLAPDNHVSFRPNEPTRRLLHRVVQTREHYTVHISRNQRIHSLERLGARCMARMKIRRRIDR